MSTVEHPAPTAEEALARVDRVVQEIVLPNADRISREEEHPAAAMKAFADEGLMGMLIPTKYGGIGVGNHTLSSAMRRISKACGSTGVTFSVHNSLCCSVLSRVGTHDQQSRYSPRLASGELLGAYSLTESHSGSDAAALRCKAVKGGDVYRITGTKAYVTNGADAGLVILFARTADTDKPSKGVSAFLVETAWPGFSVSKHENKMGLRASHCCEIVLDDVEVPAANLLGEENQGFKIAMATLDGGRIGIASQAVGIADAALEGILSLVRERPVADPFGDDQMTHFRLAEMATERDAAWLLIERAARRRDEGVPHSQEAAMAKLFASRMADRVTREAVALAGAAGIDGRGRLERYVRDARICELYEGTTEIQKLVISRALLADDKR